MKRFFIISVLLLLSMSMFAQNKEIKMDSIAIINPLNGYRIHSTTKFLNKSKILDSLNTIYRTNKFTVVSYFSDGTVFQCKVEKKPILKKESI